MERTAGTFQDRLVTGLCLAEAGSIGEAIPVLEQFLPRFNRRFRVPPQCPESAHRSLGPELSLEQVLCIKHRRKVARENTVKFHLHTLQLLPEPERPSYAGSAVEVLEGLDGRRRVRHEGRIINAQEAPASPVFLRNGQRDSATGRASPTGSDRLNQRWAVALKALESMASDEEEQTSLTGGARANSTPATVPAQTHLPAEGDVEGNSKARRKGMSLRAIQRELGIHRATIKNYMDADGLRAEGPGRLSLCLGLIQCRHEGVTFMLAFDTTVAHYPAAIDNSVRQSSIC